MGSQSKKTVMTVITGVLQFLSTSRCANSRYSIGAEQMALMPAQSKMPTIGVVLAGLVLVVFFSSSLYALVSYFLIK